MGSGSISGSFMLPGCTASINVAQPWQEARQGGGGVGGASLVQLLTAAAAVAAAKTGVCRLEDAFTGPVDSVCIRDTVAASGMKRKSQRSSSSSSSSSITDPSSRSIHPLIDPIAQDSEGTAESCALQRFSRFPTRACVRAPLVFPPPLHSLEGTFQFERSPGILVHADCPLHEFN